MAAIEKNPENRVKKVSEKCHFYAEKELFLPEMSDLKAKMTSKKSAKSAEYDKTRKI